MKNFIFVLFVGAALPFFPSASADPIARKCSAYYSKVEQALVFTDAIPAPRGSRSVSSSCLEAFDPYAIREILPRVDGIERGVILRIRVAEADLFPTIDHVLGESPHRRTSLAVHFSIEAGINRSPDPLTQTEASETAGLQDLEFVLRLKP